MKHSLLALTTLLFVLSACGKDDPKSTTVQGGVPAAPEQQGFAPAPQTQGPVPSGLSAVSSSCAEVVNIDLRGSFVVRELDRRGGRRSSSVAELTYMGQGQYRVIRGSILGDRYPGYTRFRFVPGFRGYCALESMSIRDRASQSNIVLGIRADGSIVLGGDNPPREAYPLLELRRR